MVLEAHGIAIRGLAFDSMMASYVLDAARSGHALEEVALEHLGYKALTEEDVCGRGAKAPSVLRIAPEDALNFAGERADLARQLANRLAPLLVADQLDDLFRQIEMPLVPVLADIERAGIRIDGPALAAQSRHIENELARHTTRIFELAGSRSSTSTHQSSSGRSCSTSCSSRR